MLPGCFPLMARKVFHHEVEKTSVPFYCWCVLQHDQQYPKCKCLEGLQSLKGHLHGPLHSLAREVGISSRQQSECSPRVVHN